MQSEATTIPCSGPSTLPSERMPHAPRLPTVLPPAPLNELRGRAIHQELERISFRLLTLNLVFWVLTGMAIARSCGR